MSAGLAPAGTAASFAALARMSGAKSGSSDPAYRVRLRFAAAAAGAPLSYGVVRRALYRRTAYFVKRILDGANPGDLPVEQPTRIELAINLKTAAALGLNIPDASMQACHRIPDYMLDRARQRRSARRKSSKSATAAPAKT
jgi:hypothetical protein